MKYYIGADLGTSALKLLLMDEGGQIRKTVSKAYEVCFPKPGWSEQRPEDWWEAFVTGVWELTEGEDASFFLCKELISGYLKGITGEYAPPQGYFVDEVAAEEFDKAFPPKEKLVLPGQLF